MRSPASGFRWALVVLTLIGMSVPLSAQLRVDLDVPRRLYMVYEPILATVTITNLSGRDILLEDDGQKKWFSFEIMEQDGTPIPPRSTDYTLQPLELQAGETVKRTINITPLYALHEYGLHRVKAVVLFSEMDRFFTSAPKRVEITEGTTIVKQSVGVPGTRQTRDVSLLKFRLDDGNRLYIRIHDTDEGIIYANTKLGRFLTLGKPQLIFGKENIVHVLQPSAPNSYLYTKMGLDGEVLERETYFVDKNKHPRLVKNADGMVFIVGGIEDSPAFTSEPAQIVPKLSDRPASLPEPGYEE